MSVLSAMNSTPSMPASIMRLTALTPAPPTPTTLRIGCVTDCGVETGRGSARPYSGRELRSMMFSGTSDEKTWRSRSS